MMITMRLAGAAALLIGASWVPKLALAPKAGSDGPLRILIVGGGPDRRNNQVAIESNVRYVHKLLPAGAWERVLFADGDRNHKDVLCLDQDNHSYYRAPDLPRLDGASEYDKVTAEVHETAKSAEKSGGPVLLYFTGHGSPDERGDWRNNTYDLWNGGEYSVQDLASGLKDFPTSTPITLVMVECFSGAFGNELFDSGDPNGNLSNRKICGFFASVPQRMAAGCTPEVNEEDYKDFTGYFFAALAGTDRMGRKVTGADYNGDGKIGMNEAFAYSLIHDESIDTPVCTSDVFLRRFVTTPDKEVMKASYSDVLSWASPAQSAALNALSSDLDLSGDDRLGRAYEDFLQVFSGDMETERLHDVRLIRFVRLAKSVVLGHTLETTGDPAIKARYEALLAQEAGDPLAPSS